MKRKFSLIFLFSILILGYLSVSVKGYNVEDGSTARWEITRDDVDAFLFAGEGTYIILDVVNSTADTINAMLSSNSFIEDEPFIDYTETRCSPFVVSISFLDQGNNELIQEIQTLTLFQVDRQVAIVVIENNIINENEVIFILSYDIETGLLVHWVIEDTDNPSIQTIIELTSTDFWSFTFENAFFKFILDNLYWIAPIFIIGIGMVVGYLIFYISNKKDFHILSPPTKKFIGSKK